MLPAGVKSVREIADYQDPQDRVLYLARLLEYILRSLSQDTNASLHHLIRGHLSRFTNFEGLSSAQKIRNRITHGGGHVTAAQLSQAEADLQTAVQDVLRTCPSDLRANLQGIAPSADEATPSSLGSHPEGTGSVAVFLDLDNMDYVCQRLHTTLPKAANEIRAAAAKFGPVASCSAYTSPRWRKMNPDAHLRNYEITVTAEPEFIIARDALALARGKNSPQTFVLASGDGDLSQMGQELVQSSKAFIVIAATRFANRQLVSLATQFVALENLISSKAVTEAADRPGLQRRVFLCHASGDKPAVRALYRRLSSDGFKPWLDEEDLLPGQDWNREISSAVRTSGAVIVCLSEHSRTKEGYVQKEIKYALDVADEKPEEAIFIIPARLEECVVPGRLQRWQWVNLFEDGGYGRLLAALRSCRH